MQKEDVTKDMMHSQKSQDINLGFNLPVCMSAGIPWVLHLTCQCSVGVTNAISTTKNHEVLTL